MQSPPSGILQGTVAHRRVAAVRPRVTGNSTIAGTVTLSGTGTPATVAFVSSSGTSTTLASMSGAYSSTGLAAGSYTVTASAIISGTSYVGEAANPVTVTAGGVVSGADIAFSAAGNATVTGTVTDSFNQPVSNADVTIESGAGSAATYYTNTFTRNGNYPFSGTLTLPQGVYTVIVSANSYSSQTQTLVIPAGQTSATLNFTLGPPNPVTLVSYATDEVVHITNAQTGQVVRASASATDTSIGPNIPLTFTVRVNNSTATTQATSVYIQFKDPDSLYQDINVSGAPREHKVFTRDLFDYARNPDQNNDFSYSITNYNILDTPKTSFPGYTGGGPRSPATPVPVPTKFRWRRARPRTYLYNGGFLEDINQSFPIKNTPNFYTVPQRGAVGGMIRDRPQRQLPHGRHVNEGTSNPIYIDYVNNGVTTHNRLPGPDPSTFHAWGQEYECQYLNAQDNGISTPASPSGVPRRQRCLGRGLRHSLLPRRVRRPERAFPAAVRVAPTEQDPNNNYQATWAPPYSPSDFYIDVVVNTIRGAHAFTTTRGASPPCPSIRPPPHPKTSSWSTTTRWDRSSPRPP